MKRTSSLPYYYQTMDYDKLVQEYPPPEEFVRTVYTWPKAKIEKLQEQRLLEAVRRAWEVPFYRRRWEEAGISPQDIRSTADLHKIPIYEIGDYRKSLQAAPPFGEYQGASFDNPEDLPLRLVTSGGTTGESRPMIYNAWDWECYCLTEARFFYLHGVRPGDMVLNTMGFSLHAGAHSISHACTYWLGAIPVNTGSGNITPTRRQIELIQRWGIKSILSMTDFLLHMATVAGDMGLDVKRDLPVKILNTSGETRSLERVWGCPAYDEFGAHEYGFMATECQERAGLHVYEDMFVAEIVDVDTGEPVEAGKKGNIVVTALYKTGSPVIRYNTKDLCRVVDTGRCGCGSWFTRLDHHLGRSDTMVKLRGINVWPESCGQVVGRHPKATGEYFCYAHKVGDPPRDELTVMVEYQDEDIDKEATRRELEALLRAELEVRMNVELVPRGSLAPLTGYGKEPKIKRFQDRRVQE